MEESVRVGLADGSVMIGGSDDAGRFDAGGAPDIAEEFVMPAIADPVPDPGGSPVLVVLAVVVGCTGGADVADGLANTDAPVSLESPVAVAFMAVEGFTDEFVDICGADNPDEPVWLASPAPELGWLGSGVAVLFAEAPSVADTGAGPPSVGAAPRVIVLIPPPGI